MTSIHISHLDHLVLTVRDIEATCDFYSRALWMQVVTFGAGRSALHFGQQKINLHQAGAEFEPKAQQPTPGSADLCFISATHLSDVIGQLTREDIPIESGPLARTGAVGAMQSIYLRDPDGHLIEISNYTA